MQPPTRTHTHRRPPHPPLHVPAHQRRHPAATPQFTHHGMVYVPAGYIFGKLQFDNSFVHGGSPYGPGTLAGPTGASVPHALEIEFAEAYGEHFGKIAMALKAARDAPK